MKETNLVRISNVLNLTRQEFTTIEKHIFLNTLLELKEQQGYNIDIDNDVVGIKISFDTTTLKETNRERVKEALDKITSKKIHFDNSTDKKDYFGYVVPFISAKYDATPNVESTITVIINGSCKKLFLDLSKGYTTTDLKAILSLRSPYSIRMYELITMYKNQGSWMVTIEKLKDLLGLEYTQYKNYADFEKRILTYSQTELWEHCNLHFEWEVAAKQRKKITALTFKIKERNEKEVIELSEEIKATQDFIQNLSPADVKQKATWVKEKYTLTDQQFEYILANKKVFNEFIRVDLIIEDKIAKGNPPRDNTKYLAKSLGLDKVKFPKKK